MKLASGIETLLLFELLADGARDVSRQAQTLRLGGGARERQPLLVDGNADFFGSHRALILAWVG